MTRPDDIPADVWDYAVAAERIWNGSVNANQIEGHARHILAERRRREEAHQAEIDLGLAAAIRNGGK